MHIISKYSEISNMFFFQYHLMYHQIDLNIFKALLNKENIKYKKEEHRLKNTGLFLQKKETFCVLKCSDL